MNELSTSRPRGRPARQIEMSYVRDLTESDLARLATRGATDVVPPLRKARAIHHRQAQLIAEGRPLSEVATICGTTTFRLSRMQDDPTFSDLIAFYVEQMGEVEFEAHKRIQATLVDILEITANEIQERMENDEVRTKTSLAELRKTAEWAGDRTVTPPRATQSGSATPPTKIELNFGWDGRPSANNQPKTIDANPEP